MDPPVTPDRAAKIRDLFEKAVGLTPDDRIEFLDQTCQGDSALQREVETLLEAFERADDVLYDLELPYESAEDANIGCTISHYEIISVLGRGGMGVVYKAIDTRLRRTVALKFLPPHLSGHADAKRRLIREARAASRLDHPTICTVYDIDEVDGQMFIVMEFVDGLTLADKISYTHFDISTAVRIIVDVATGLATAHASGIVHRDIKPANVMLTTTGSVKIMDFGLAKLITETAHSKSGMAFGTASYMSPEQARGAHVDSRSDLFSLGVVFYEMITGTRAFRGDFPEAIIYSILNEDPEAPSALRADSPIGLDNIVSKCMAKNASERYQSAGKLIHDLQTLDTALSSESGILAVKKDLGLSNGNRSHFLNGPNRTATPGKFRRAAPIFLVISAIALAMLAGNLIGQFSSTPASPRPLFAEITIKSRGFLWPGISPDGRYLAYTGNGEKGNEHILFIHDFETGNTSEHRREQAIRRPLFSPDADQIGFLEDRNLLIGPLDFSSPPARIFEMGRQYVWWLWAPDGTILFIRDDLKTVERITSDGRRLSNVAVADTSRAEVTLWPMSFFPDGRVLIGAEDSIGALDLFAVDLETHVRSPLPEMRNNYSLIMPSGHILYWPLDPPSVTMYARAFDMGSLTYTSDPIEAFKIRNITFAISETGRVVNYEDERSPWYEPRRLYRIDRNGNRTELTFPENTYRRIRIAPTGERISFVTAGILQVADLNRGNRVVQLTNDGSSRNHAWSADGARIHFDYVRYNPPVPRRVLQIDSRAAGDTLTILSPDFLNSLEQRPDEWGRHFSLGDVSRDENYVALLDNSRMVTAHAITIISRHNLSVVRTISHPSGVSAPRFSPDGRFLAYTNDTVPNSQIHVAAVVGDPVHATLVSEGGAFPIWSTDSRFLYFVRDSAIFELPIQVGDSVEPTGPEREVYRSTYHFEYDVLPDGSGFIVAEATDPPRRTISVKDHFFEWLKENVPASK